MSRNGHSPRFRLLVMAMLLLLLVSLAPPLSVESNSMQSETTTVAATEGRINDAELIINLTSADSEAMIDISNVTVRIIDVWSGLDREESIVSAENGSLLRLSGVSAGSVRLEVEAVGFAIGHPPPILIGGVNSETLNHTISLTLAPLNSSFGVYASSGSVASADLYLDAHAKPLAASLVDANATLAAPANKTGWLYVNGTSGSRLAAWDGNASNSNIIVDISQSLRLFAPEVNGSGSILARHSPSAWSQIIYWQDGIDTTLPRIDSGNWQLNHLLDGAPLVGDEKRVDGPFWDISDWLATGPGVIDSSTAGGSGGTGDDSAQLVAATLDLSGGTLAVSTPLNATWSATWSLPGHQGTALLPAPENGIKHQIDRWLGDGDGVFEQSEAASFESLFALHGWLDAEAAGCCLYDKTPMTSALPVFPSDITIEGLGDSTFATGHQWGWAESADLTGAADSRTTRLLWLPLTGHAREELLIRVILPDSWEFRHSPQRSLVEGEPGDFTIDRGATSVATDVRITLGENQPPSISVDISGGTERFLPLNQLANLTVICSDTSIGEVAPEWRLRDGPEVVVISSTTEVSVSGVGLGLVHGDRVIMEASCSDWHGAVSEWNSTAEIDGVAPTIDWHTFEDRQIGQPLKNALKSDGSLQMNSTSTLILDIWSNDSSAEQVLINFRSNRTDGWQHDANDHLQLADIWPVSNNVNGLHLSIEDRHRQKALTTYWLDVSATDSVGNIFVINRTLTLLDATAPTSRPALRVDGKLYGPSNYPTNESIISVNLSESYDDIDAVESINWLVALDDDVIIGMTQDGLMTGVNWSEVESFELPTMAVGWHGLTVIATDSSGNVDTHSAEIQVWPQNSAELEVVEVSLLAPTEGGAVATFSVVVENYGRDGVIGTVCIRENCSAATDFFGATVNGPSSTNVTISVDAATNGQVIVLLNWSAMNGSGLVGESTYASDIIVLPGWIGPVRGLIWVILGLAVIAWGLERRFGA